MTELARANRRTNQAALAGIGLAALLAAGIIGGVVGARLVTTGGVERAPNAILAPGAQVKYPTTLDPKWVEYGNAWERQYRAMNPTTLDPKWVAYGNAWESQYRAMNPTTLDPKWVEYGNAWESQYRAMHPDQ